ncbi:unnamed protein product [Rotaria magnacalcarata]|uniref:Integrase catalytic domain-containing protein n=1 Tax=Rotaria magnacalcarata TaxID=392030 RepID=A0A819Y0A5_9BILA|nr:unnamed protein product [Rotaria magnacalcarata]
MRPFNGRIARTLEFLSNYNFEVVWIQGKENTWPDMLSRTCNWNEDQKNLLALNTIENYTYLPDKSNIATPEYELEDNTPIIFKTEKENAQNRKIFIQSVEVDVKLAIINAQIPYTTIDQIVNESDDPIVDTVDPLAYLNLANSDFRLNTNDFVEKRNQHIQTIKHNLKEIRNINLDDKIRPTLPKTVSYLEHTKAYDQEMNGQFREVHPEGYGSWYTRCCSHPYTTDCFVPLSCGDLRFCGNLDTGSSCSVLSLDVAEKLFKANKLTKLYDTQIHLVCAGGISKDIRTRIVSADISMGTARLRGVKFILLPKEMMFSCAIIGNEVLSLKGLHLDFGSRVVQYNETIVVELARLRHPRFYTHRHLPPVENNMVLPITPEPYIQLEPGSTEEMINEIFYKMSQNVEETPQLSIEYFLSELDLLELQNSNKEIRRIRRIMSYPNFKFPPYLAHYNKIKNNLLIQVNIVYYKKAPYDQVPLLPTNCIITMALRIHDKYSHCGRDKLVDWVRTIAYHINLSELLGRICSCLTCLLKKSHPLKHTPPTIKIQTTYPFELVVGDLLSMPQQGRYKYIFTVVDHYSKFAAAWPLKDKSSQTVADALEKHIFPTFIMRPKPLTPIELHRYSEECDPVENRTFSRNWRPSDETCEIDAEDLSDDFNEDQEAQNLDHESNSDHESDSESDEEGASGGYKQPTPDPSLIIMVPPSQIYNQIPKNSGVGEPSNTHTNWNHRNMSSPYVNTYGIVNKDNPSQTNTHEQLRSPPQPFTPTPDNNNFLPIQPIPHVFTPTAVYKYPQRTVHTPEINKTPSYFPRQIFTPPNSSTDNMQVPTTPNTPPVVNKGYTHNLNELNKSPITHCPSPQNYFNNNARDNANNNQNNQDTSLDCKTPPYNNKYYQNLLNDVPLSNSPSSPYSHQTSPRTTGGQSPDQVTKQEPQLISESENEMSVPTTTHNIKDNEPRYRASSPSIMKTRSQTRRENAQQI